MAKVLGHGFNITSFEVFFFFFFKAQKHNFVYPNKTILLNKINYKEHEKSKIVTLLHSALRYITANKEKMWNEIKI